MNKTTVVLYSFEDFASSPHSMLSAARKFLTFDGKNIAFSDINDNLESSLWKHP